ncbi:MAG: thioredoxin family protein [Flavobacteriaceae bacterium]|nr:thioredoxin family protein [Flavobacteriaceae bacterium]
MKKLVFFSLFFIASIGANSQNWIKDIDEAKQIASEKNLRIILVFQGSDWCAPCIKLDREIWSTEEFKAYAKDHYVMLQADFPRSKKNKLSKEQQEKNNKLAEKYNKNGYFPFVVVLDKNGKVLEETGYFKTTPQGYIEQLNSSSK